MISVMGRTPKVSFDPRDVVHRIIFVYHRSEIYDNSQRFKVTHFWVVGTFSTSQLYVSSIAMPLASADWCARGDLLMALAWCLPTGFDTPITYFYLVYFAVLLIHRQRRDDEACHKK
jgi:hypothetical protein